MNACNPLGWGAVRIDWRAPAMQPGNEVDEWGGSAWEQRTPGESKREAGLEDLVKKAGDVPEWCSLESRSFPTSETEKQPVARGSRPLV